MRIGIISGVIGVFITLSGFFVKFGGKFFISLFPS